MCVNPLLVRISTRNTTYTMAAAMRIHTIGRSMFDAAAGRVRACVHAADTLLPMPIRPRHIAAMVGNRSPSGFGYPRITLPHSRDSIGDVQ